MVDSNHNLAVTSSNPPKRILRRIQAHPRPLDRPDASMRAPFCSPNESRNPGVCMCSCTHKKPTETPTKQFIKSSWRNLRSGLFPTAPPTHQDVSTPADAGQLPRAEQVRGVGGGGLLLPLLLLPLLLLLLPLLLLHWRQWWRWWRWWLLCNAVLLRWLRVLLPRLLILLLL